MAKNYIEYQRSGINKAKFEADIRFAVKKHPTLAGWASEIMRNAKKALHREEHSGTIEKIFRDKGFDVRQQAAAMEAFYISGVNPPGHVTPYRSFDKKGR